MLTPQQISFYSEHGYLRIPQLFTPEETQELSNELDRLVEDWAFTNPGWTGPWRLAYMDPETEKKARADGHAGFALLLGRLDAGRHQSEAGRGAPRSVGG